MQIYINHPNNKKEIMKKIFFRTRKGKKERKNCEIRKKTLILQPNSVKQTWRSHPSLTKQTMANRRKLKKTINYNCAELMAECVASMQCSDANIEDAKGIMLNILKLQDDMISRASHVQPGMKASAFFQKLESDMTKRTEDIIEQLNGLV